MVFLQFKTMENTSLFNPKPWELRSEMRRKRDRELLHCYRSMLRQMLDNGEFIDRGELVRRIIRKSRPCFYVSFFRAYRMVGKILHSGRIDVKNPESAAMWLDLAQKVRETMAENPHLIYRDALVRTLCDKRANRFYLSEDYVYKILYKVIKENKTL